MYILISVLITQYSFSLGQDNDDATESYSGEIEEILVEGKINKESYTRLTEKLEDDLFALFNEINSDHEFDIVCEYRYTVGSWIKTRICQTEYMKKAYHLAARNARDGMSTSIMGELTSKGRSFYKLFNRMLDDNPELQFMADDLNEIKLEYMDSRRDYMKARIEKMISLSR